MRFIKECFMVSNIINIIIKIDINAKTMIIMILTITTTIMIIIIIIVGVTPNVRTRQILLRVMASNNNNSNNKKQILADVIEIFRQQQSQQQQQQQIPFDMLENIFTIVENCGIDEIKKQQMQQKQQIQQQQEQQQLVKSLIKDVYNIATKLLLLSCTIQFFETSARLSYLLGGQDSLSLLYRIEKDMRLLFCCCC